MNVTVKEKRTKKNVNFVRLEPILELLRAAIWSARLGDEKPVSVLLVAEQESAKTEMLKYFAGTSTLAYISDLTSRGLRKHKDAIERGKIRHLVLLDLVRVIAHGRSVQERTFQTLAALMEEGESETLDAGGSSEWVGFPRIGCLMALTPAFFRSKRGRWRETGFMTRFVPVSFKYTDETKHAIHMSIGAGMQLPPPHPEKISELSYGITIADKYSRVIVSRAEELGNMMQTYGFRYQKSLRSLAKANALLNKRNSVNDADIGKVLGWSEFFTQKEIEI
jgi:hypothetical protein